MTLLHVSVLISSALVIQFALIGIVLARTSDDRQTTKLGIALGISFALLIASVKTLFSL